MDDCRIKFMRDFDFAKDPSALHGIHVGVNAQQRMEARMEGEGEEGAAAGEQPREQVEACLLCGRLVSEAFLREHGWGHAGGRNMLPACLGCCPRACAHCGRPVTVSTVWHYLKSGPPPHAIFCRRWGCREWAPLRARAEDIDEVEDVDEDL